MTPQTEARACEVAAAARFREKMGCDEFEVWHRDPDVRRRIFQAAKLCEDNVNTAQDLIQDAWLEICQLPPGSSRGTVLAAAWRAINRVYQRQSWRGRKVRIILDPNL